MRRAWPLVLVLAACATSATRATLNARDDARAVYVFKLEYTRDWAPGDRLGIFDGKDPVAMLAVQFRNAKFLTAKLLAGEVPDRPIYHLGPVTEEQAKALRGDAP
jgi:hypothetical protein